MGAVIVGLYVLCSLTALLNLVLMRRPRRDRPALESEIRLCILIPARNEAENLRYLIPALLAPNPGLQVIVFDDESEDETAQVAAATGATVVRPSETLPTGWTGKNRACHELALAAAKTEAEWFLFLDADVQPKDDFIPAMRSLCRDAWARRRIGLVTGFPTILPGKGIEPLFLAWVGWALLASNPYGLVSRSGLGHNRFKNGQVHCWKREVYLRIMPNERVKNRIMEDVEIGRLLAREGVPVEVANLSSVLSVRMYDHWRETLDGMSKNSYEITNSDGGSIAVAALLVFLAWGWIFTGSLWPWALGCFMLSGLAVVIMVRTSWWPVLLMPLIPTIGAFTVLRSMLWHRRGTVRWKGRVYPGRTTVGDKAGSTPAES